MREIASRNNYDEGYWDEQTQFLCLIANELAIIKYYNAANLWRQDGEKAKQSNRPKLPELIHPPGWRKPVVEMSPTEDVLAMFGAGGAQYAP